MTESQVVLADDFAANRRTLAYLQKVFCPRCERGEKAGMIAAVVWHDNTKYLWIVGGRDSHTAARLGRADVRAAGARQMAEAAAGSLSRITEAAVDHEVDPRVVTTTQAFARYAETAGRADPAETPGAAGPLPTNPNESLTFPAIPCPRCRKPSRIVAQHTGVTVSI